MLPPVHVLDIELAGRESNQEQGGAIPKSRIGGKLPCIIELAPFLSACSLVDQSLLMRGQFRLSLV